MACCRVLGWVELTQCTGCGLLQQSWCWPGAAGEFLLRLRTARASTFNRLNLFVERKLIRHIARRLPPSVQRWG